MSRSAVFLDARGAVLIAFLTLTVLAPRCSCTECPCRCASRNNKTSSEVCDLIRKLQTSEDKYDTKIEELVKKTSDISKEMQHKAEVDDLKGKLRELEKSTSDKVEKMNRLWEEMRALVDAMRKSDRERDFLAERLENLKRLTSESQEGLSTKLRDLEKNIRNLEGENRRRTSEVKKELKRVEKQNVQSKAEVLDRLRETESRLNETDRLILTKIQEAIDELSGKVQETTTSLTTKLENLQTKMKKIKNTVSTLLASQSELKDEIRKNLSPSVQHLKAYTEEHFTKLKQVGGNMTVKIRQFEDSLVMLEQELSNCAPLANFSDLDRTVREQARASRVEHQSLRSEMSLRVVEVRRQCADRDDVARMNSTLFSLATDLNEMRGSLEMVKKKVLKPKCKDTLPPAACKRKVEDRLCSRSEDTAIQCCASCAKAL